MIHNVLIKYKSLLKKTLGTWKTKPIDTEVQPDAKIYHAKI